MAVSRIWTSINFRSYEFKKDKCRNFLQTVSNVSFCASQWISRRVFAFKQNDLRTVNTDQSWYRFGLKYSVTLTNVETLLVLLLDERFLSDGLTLMLFGKFLKEFISNNVTLMITFTLLCYPSCFVFYIQKCKENQYSFYCSKLLIPTMEQSVCWFLSI